MKVESFADLFKYSKELLDDDYNQGQAFVFKTKTRGSDNVTVSANGYSYSATKTGHQKCS